MKMAKLTAKNQLTLPSAVVQALGAPTHFRVQVHEGVLLLWPARLVCSAGTVRPEGQRRLVENRIKGKG